MTAYKLVNRDVFHHDVTCPIFDSKGTEVGEIELRVQFEIASWGRPARVRFDEHDHPIEYPEIDVIDVQMYNAPKSGSKAVLVDAWDWLYEWAGEWGSARAEELAGVASLELRRGDE